MSDGPPMPPGSGTSDGWNLLDPLPTAQHPGAVSASSGIRPTDVAAVDATPDTDATTQEPGTQVTSITPDPEGVDGPDEADTFVTFDERAFLDELPEGPADERPVTPLLDGVDDATLADYESSKEVWSAAPNVLQLIIRTAPGPDYVYMESLGATVSVKETKREYEREMAKRAAELVINAQTSGDLLSAMERAMDIDHAAILEKVTDEDYDPFDRIVVGHRQRGIKLIGRDHMVRILAQKKAGKTTSIMEIMRCSITGEEVFGAFEIQPIDPDETILFIDPELSPLDYEDYVRKAFTGMTDDEVNRIKRFSTRNQNVVPPGTDPNAPRPAPAMFDLSSEATRDVLIQICNRYNVSRVVFDSYVKLIPGSMNKDDDVKRMLANWAAIQGSTNVRESFWVGHINNSGEVRSSGSMLLDGTFESLLAITVDATGRRFLQAQAGRGVDELEPVEIVVNDKLMGHERPVINLDSDIKPVIEETPGAGGPGRPAPAPKAPKGAKVAEEINDQVKLTKRIVLEIMYPHGPHPTKDGRLRRGGYSKDDLTDEVVRRWPEFSRWVAVATKKTVHLIISEMMGLDWIVSEHPLKGVKKLWLTEHGEAQRLRYQEEVG